MYQTGHLNPEDYDQYPADFPYEIRMTMKKPADIGERGRNGHENRGETGDEEKRMDCRLFPDGPGRVLLIELGERQPGDIGDVGRDQRQNAGGQERPDSGGKGGDVTDVGGLHEKIPLTAA